jgi:hypothetical protein
MLEAIFPGDVTSFLLNGIPNSNTVNGVAEVPLTDIAIEAFRRQLAISGPGPFLFPSEEDPNAHQKTFKTAWRAPRCAGRASYIFGFTT